MNPQSSPAILIISAMITPAFLILGTGSLVATVLQRLARSMDRIRILLQQFEGDSQKQGPAAKTSRHTLKRYGQRLLICERAVTIFFAAIGVYVLDCLSIAVDRYFGDSLPWLPVGFTILGMLLMLGGVYLMLMESRMASQQIREEIDRMNANYSVQESVTG